LPGVPDTVQPGGMFSMIVRFSGDSSGGVYLDTVVLTVGDPTFYSIYLKGISFNPAPSGVTQDAPNSAELRVFPNPSTGTTSLELVGVSEASYEVRDILGHLITQHSGVGAWQWSADAVPEAIYYIHADGHDTQGHEFVTTRRLVIIR